MLYYWGRYDEALGAYNKAISLNPNEENAYTGKGNVLIAMEKTEEALACYEKVI